MNPERPQNKPALRDLFLTAVELRSGPEREAYLQDIRGKHPELFAKLMALLHNEKDDSFLEEPAAERASALTVSPALPEGPGTLIGKYKLLEQLGEGGFGVVYMAEQKEPVKRRVALKIIKVGMDTREVVARFEAERQALAIMDHPNIAKVHDGGATETGRPYFVMELVRGVKITDHCDEKNLSTRERLDLFMQVCHAVQHAHQKGIIHRDLKPSNILVTVNDGAAVPKIIDFGIAKATQLELTEKTVFTRFHQFIGTPAYLSPEQADISSVDIDTRSDIYSLGVLLYELLTGKTPFDAKELLQAGLDEMRRTIREKEPARPSTRVGTLGADELTTTAKRRGVEPPKLVNVLCGDLDWIVMKCLEKDRARRYETANGLAMDLQRHLNCKPVLARPPSRLYEFQKTVRRHKVGFAAAGAVLLALLLGLGVSTWMFLRERDARREQVRLRRDADTARSRARADAEAAKTEAVKSQQIAQFLKDTLKAAGPEVAKGRDVTLMLEILDKAGKRVGTDLTNQPEVEAELEVVLAETYGLLGNYARENELATQALQIARGLGTEKRVLADASLHVGDAQLSLSHFEEAEAAYREAVRLRTKLLGPQSVEVAEPLCGLAFVLYSRQQLPEAEATSRQAVAICRLAPGKGDELLSESLHSLAAVLRLRQQLDEAERSEREALALRLKLMGHESLDVASSLNNLGIILKYQGRLAEAELAYREALDVRHRLLGDKHQDVAVTTSNLGAVLEAQAKLDEAEGMYRQALQIYRGSTGSETMAVAYALGHLGSVLQAKGKLAEAEAAYREELAIQKRALGAENLQVATPLADLARVLGDRGKWVEAEPVLRDCLGLREKQMADDWRTFYTRSMLGGSLLGQKKYSDAEPLLLLGYEGMKQREKNIPREGRPRLKEALQRLVQFYEETGQPEKAAQRKQQFADFEKAEIGNKPAAK